jgi:class 3 adenylate cyclase
MLIYVGVCLIIGYNIGSTILPFEAVLFFSLPFLFYLKVPPKIIGHLYITIGWSFGIVLCSFSGGLYSPVMPWLTLMPICAILFIGRREAWIWAFILLATVLAMAGYWFLSGEFPKSYNTNVDLFFFTNCYAGLIFIYLLLSIIFEMRLTRAYEKVEKQNFELAIEKDKSEKLLLNILPAEVAEELKEKGHSDAHLYDNVTVLFTDFVGFTKISERMSPTELVGEINYCFSAFDRIITNNNLEKIKTIGDAYLAVCGLPLSDVEHAEKVVLSALDIQTFMNEYKKEREAEGREFFQVRIGIHTGSVVAGIVGIKKYAYDIWGDTVNTAARMEQNSHTGRINVSETTYALIKDKFTCTHRGKIDAKNKGEIDMYFVE